MKINKKVALLLAGALTLSTMSGCMLETPVETQEPTYSDISDSDNLDDELNEVRYGVDYENVVDTKNFAVGEHIVVQYGSGYDSEIWSENGMVQYAINVPDGYMLLDSSISIVNSTIAVPHFMYVFVNEEEVEVNGYYDYTNNIIVYPDFGTPSIDLEHDYQKTK